MPGSLENRLRYNNWANALLYRELTAKHAPEGARRAMQHVFETELTWSGRILGLGNPKLELWARVSEQLRSEWLRTARRQMEQVSFAESPGRFERLFRYQTYSGEEHEDSVGEVLEHTLIHSAQYRGEAAGLSNAAGIQMPDLDYIFWQRSGEPAGDA